MSEGKEILLVFRRYWKTLLKWIFRIHGLPEITVDDARTGIPPFLISARRVRTPSFSPNYCLEYTVSRFHLEKSGFKRGINHRSMK